MFPHEATARPSLAAERLSLAYGKSLIFQGLDLEIPAGSFTALVGPNGSGKSTLLRALAGLLAPDHGRVLLDDASIAGLSARQIARRIGVLAQGPGIVEGFTVLDLVRQGRYPHRGLFAGWSGADDRACDTALSLTGMDELKDRTLDSLSGGQRQRAWIAMTLAQETAILLLDEPTTFLDLAHQIEVLELASDLVRERGQTVVAVLHDLNQAARYADHLVMLKEGRIVAAGAPAGTMSAERVEQVFGVRSTIIKDPVSGTPMCVPLGRSRRKTSSQEGV